MTCTDFTDQPSVSALIRRGADTVLVDLGGIGDGFFGVDVTPDGSA